MGSPNILPNSIPKVTRGRIFRAGLAWIPIFCANCGAPGGHVVEGSYDFAFWLCVPCAEKWEPLAGTYMIPDEVFWAKVKAAQLEAFGRELTVPEIIEALKDEHHVLSKLARERNIRGKE